MKTNRSFEFLRITIYISVLLLIAFETPSSVYAQDPTPTDDEVNRIANQLYCPVCESTPLDACPTEACRQWRDLIHQMLAEGKSEGEIKQYFVAQYGARVLNEPPNQLASYAVPFVAFLFGAILLFRGFRMWIKPVETEAGTGRNEAKPVHQDEYIQQMEQELQKRK